MDKTNICVIISSGFREEEKSYKTKMLNIQNISIRHAKGNLNETSYLHLLRNKKSQKLSLNKKLKQSIFYLKYHLCNIFRASASASIKLVHKIFLFVFVSNLGKAFKAKTKKNDSLCRFYPWNNKQQMFENVLVFRY